MNNYEESRADNFIRHIAKIIYSNPSNLSLLETLYDTVYYELMNYEIANREKQVTVRHLFPIFIDYYKKNNAINCFETPIIKNFLLFNHCNDMFPNIKNEIDPIKMFIPLDREHIEVGLKNLFNFAISEDIAFEAKLADRLRTDNVTIRVARLEDAMKLIEYINNNSYIKEGLLPLNPFCFEVFNIGFAIDGRKSYNTVLVRLITEYIREEYKMDTTEGACLSKFINFLNTKCNFGDEELDEIKNLISKSAYKNCNLSDFYNNYMNLSRNKMLKNADMKEDISIKDAFRKSVVVTIKKYGIVETKERIGRYIQIGNSRFFTRYDKYKDDGINYRSILDGALGEKYKTYEKRLDLLNELCDITDYAADEAIDYYIENEIIPIIGDEYKVVESEN